MMLLYVVGCAATEVVYWWLESHDNLWTVKGVL